MLGDEDRAAESKNVNHVRFTPNDSSDAASLYYSHDHHNSYNRHVYTMFIIYRDAWRISLSPEPFRHFHRWWATWFFCDHFSGPRTGFSHRTSASTWTTCVACLQHGAFFLSPELFLQFCLLLWDASPLFLFCAISAPIISLYDWRQIKIIQRYTSSFALNIYQTCVLSYARVKTTPTPMERAMINAWRKSVGLVYAARNIGKHQLTLWKKRLTFSSNSDWWNSGGG